MGVAFCRGLEGGGVIATPKHFLANYGEGGRDSNPVTLSERTLREIFLPPFEACFREGGATSVMTALNSIDGVPCSTNRWLLGRVLRGEWGFRGFVVSDYGALPGVLEHGTAASLEEVAAQALLAGVDMELQSKEVYGPPLVQALQEHRVSRASLDAAVRRVLRVKAFHGLLDGAGDTAPAPPPETVGCAEHHALALQAAREGLVLLKNDGLLPLSPARYRIAVLGAAAAAPVLGSYSFTNGPVVTMLQGIRARAGAPVTYAPGCGVGTLEPFDPLPEVLLSTPGARRARGVRAEYFETHIDGPVLLSRTERSISLDPGHPALTPELHAKLAAIRWSARFESPASGTYMLIVRYEGGGVRVWLDGQLLKDAAPPPSHGGAEFVPMHLEAHRSYSLGVEFFRSEGESQLELLCDLPNARRLAEAAAAARAADVAIVVVASLEGEGWDRSSLDLPGAQEPLIQAVAATGTPTAVVVLAGAPITMRSWLNAARAVVLPWYPGDQGGTAVAEALFGDFSPAGRLSIGFPKTVGQAPLPYRAAPSGRSFSYLDADGPQFAFGFGLGYTRFEYDGLRIEPAVIPPSGSAVVHVTVKNVGARAGDEVVQLYVRQQVASVVRPLLELKGFERVTLQPGEAREVTFRLGPAELSLLDRNLRRVVEPGHFTVMVGAASSDIRVRGELTVRE
jgi:beta-glucosidase